MQKEKQKEAIRLAKERAKLKAQQIAERQALKTAKEKERLDDKLAREAEKAAKIAAREAGGFLVLSVADDGPGLPEVVRASLFQPFVTSKQGGMGIGLSICRTIVEAHGGRGKVDRGAIGPDQAGPDDIGALLPALQARLVLADEPTASLDPLNAERVMQALLAQAREHRAACVIATHDEPLARASGLQVRRISCRRDTDGGVTATLGEAC